MLNYKGTAGKQQVQKQAKPLSGLTRQQTGEFIQYKMNFPRLIGNYVTGVSHLSTCNQCIAKEGTWPTFNLTAGPSTGPEMVSGGNSHIALGEAHP